MKKPDKDQLWDYVEGGLSGPEKADVEKWLAADAGNRQQLEDIRSLSEALRSMETDVPSMRFTVGVMEAWDRELALKSSPLHTRTDKRIVYGIAALLAGTLLFAFGLLITSSGGNFPLPAQLSSPGTDWSGNIGDTLGRLFAGTTRYFVGLIIILLMVLLERCIHYRQHMRGMR